MLISLVLATFGRSDDVGRCLQSLAAQTDKTFEVLLVDQNPDDRLVPCVSEALASGLNLHHLRMVKPSLSGARNLGILKSKGEIIGFPDDDCWYDPDAIAQLRQAIAGGSKFDGVVANWVEQSAAHPSNPSEEILSYRSWRSFRGGDASSITLFLKRRLLQRLSGFDERMGVGRWFGAGEETDLVLRALANGAVIHRLPNVRVHHLYGAPPKGTLAVRCRNIRTRAHGTGALYAKHRLNTYTVIRGLTAPLLLPLVRLRGWEAVAIGFAIAVGRLEGLIRWGWGKP